MANKKFYSKRWRVRKAYTTAFVIIVSYLRLWLISKIMGNNYYERRLLPLHIKNANRVKKTILELQGLFIKVGQLISILTNFLPDAFEQHLEELQDKIPARPIEEIRDRIEQELGQTPEQLFIHFSETPIAAASIGQAHRATLRDGTDVVIKIQHKNIEKIAEIDLTIMQKLTHLTSWFMDIKGMDYAYTQVRKMIEEELDFTKEASSMQVIRENLKDELHFAIPEVHLEYSTQRVLTSTFHEGVKISNLAQLKVWDINQHHVAQRLLHAYCEMVFKDGFYHADPHPGNILVQEDGTIVLLDFGAVATLRPEIRTGFLELLEGAAKNDTDKIINAFKMLGFIADNRESEKMAEKMVDAFRNFIQNEIEFEGLNFKDIKVNPFETSLFNLIQDIGFKGIANTVQVPKDYVLLNRMVTLLVGICSTLDSNMNPIVEVRPYFQDFILGEKGDTVKFFKDIIQRTAANLLALPGDFHKTLTLIKKGQMEVQVIGEAKKTKLFYALGHQFIYTLLLIASAAFAYLFYKNNDIQLFYYALASGGLFLFLLLRSMRSAGKLKRQL